MTDPLGSKESRSADAKEEERILTSAAAALSSSLAGGDVAKAEALLDFIKGRLLLSGTTLPLEAAQACGGALALSTTPQVAAKACLALGSGLQLCRHCASPGSEELAARPDPAPLAAQLAAALRRHPGDVAAQAAGLHLLLCLAACTTCGQPCGGEQQDALGQAGAVPAAAAALARLCSAASGDAPGQPQPAAAIGDGLRALHCVCAGHEANLGCLAAAGGVPVVAAAMAAAASDCCAREQGLLLLARLACRGGAALEEQQAASAAIWRAAQEQAPADRRRPEVARAAVWGMARLLQRLLARTADGAAAAQTAGELQLQGTAVVLAILQTCGQQDDPLTRHCLDFLAVAAVEGRHLPAPASAALLSRDAAAAVLVAAGTAGEARTQAAALRTLHRLCQAGGCGLTWRQLAATQPPAADQLDAELVAGGASLAAAVFALLGGAADGDAAQDQVAVRLYGLAAVGALLAVARARSPAAAAALAARLHAAHLAGAQEAVAAACGALGRSPELLALLEAQPQEESAPCTVDLDWSIHGCHLASRQEPVGWQAAADAVRGVCALLSCGAEGLNAGDAEGCTLLHRLAMSGQARCLQLLLAAGGPGLDLLVRTRGGATALQLAGQHRHAACVQVLEAATQEAAEARQEALLKELEEMEEDGCGAAAGGKKGKKKKAVTRSTSFAAEQPEEKAQKVAGGDRCDEEMAAAAPGSGAEAEQQRELEGRLRAQQEHEEAYERALEARRLELAALQAAAPHAGEAAGGSSGSHALSGAPRRQPSQGSDGKEDQPGTPDQQEEQPSTPSAQAGAGGGDSAGGHSSSDGSSSPELGAQQQQQQQQHRLLTAAAQGLAPPAQHAAAQQQRMPPSPFAPLGSPGGSSLYSEPGGGYSLFGSPTMAGSLLGVSSPQLPAAIPLSGSALPHAGPSTRHPAFPSPPHGGTLGAPGGGGLSPASQRPGLPPLPGRQPSFGAAAAAGSPRAASAAAASQQAQRAQQAQREADHLLSVRLQDALFVGSPSLSSPTASGPLHGQPESPRRHPLFASLSRRGDERDDGDADSSHLLSSSLSCLDDGPMMGRASSGSTQGSGSPSTAAAAAARKQLAAATAADALMHGMWAPPGSCSPSSAGATGDSGSEGSACYRVPDLSGDESLDPTRHLWIGNLGTRTPRALLKTLFERFGTVDDVVTFPGRMYAFVNYRTTEEAVLAFDTLQDQQVAELTGDRRLLIKYRPAKKAAVHLRALGLVDEDGVPTEERMDLDRDGNSADPSPRIWLGNIAPTATSKSLHAVLGRFGVLTDAAVFPARIGPLGYAFVKFERLEDAVRAFEALNNTVVAPLSGSKQLKMRYKPANDGPAGRGEDPSDPGKAVMVPSRHLWLGNITQKPTDEQVLEVFASFGKVDSVRVFPVKAYAFVNYADIGSAIKAMQAVEGLAIPQLTGVKPLVMRYQQESGGSSASTPKPPSSVAGSAVGLLPHVASEAALSAALGLNQLVPGASLASFLTGTGATGTAVPSVTATTTAPSADGSGSDDGLMPVPNLSNKLNPNNLHYDAELAERYKHMNRREKDLMWAADSLLHPADPAKGMLRSASSGYLSAAGAPSSPAPNAAAVAAAATAQAHAAMAVLLQHQQQQGGGAGGSMLTSQLLALHQLSPGQPAPPAQQSQLSSGASASQLTAVLNNLTAMRRTGSLPGSGSGGLLSLQQQQQAPPLASSHSLPPQLPGMSSQQQQQEYLHQLLLQQQQQQQQQEALGRMDAFGSGHLGMPPAPAVSAAAASPSHQISRLSSMLAGQSLGPAGCGALGCSTPMLSPCPSGGAPLSPDAPRGLPTMHPHHHLPQHQAQQAQHSQAHTLAAALGQLAAQAGGRGPAPLAPPSPGAHHGLPPMHAGGGAAALNGSLPHHFYCPLTRQLMSDPVLAADGVTYERQAIAEWMAYKDVSPTTQLPLPHKVLSPNSVLRAGLLDLLRQHC